MSLFSKSKDKSEQRDASDIKQATISDTQMNSMQNNNQLPAPSQDTNNAQQGGQNFVNPFSGQSSSQSNMGQNSFEQQQSFNNAQNFNPDSLQVTQQQNNSMQQSQPQQGMQQNDVFANMASMQTNQSNGIDFDKIQEMIDETVEKIIEEKWNTLEDKVNKVLRWKENKDAEINMLKEDLVTLGEGFSKLEMKLINKISNYDKNILDVNSEIKALEKVFQKVTPTLINNVNELSKIADEFKGIKPRNRKVMTEDDFMVDDEPTSQNNSNRRTNSSN